MSDGRPTHLDLFSGIGGFALATRWAGFRTVAFCEIDSYCQKVLQKNFGAVLGAASTGAGNSPSKGWANCRCSEEILSDSTSNGRDSGKTEGGAATPVREPAQGETTNGNAQGRSGSRLQQVRCYGNIFDFDGTQFRGVDLITGGFPCQPFSVAGQRRGAADDRAIWPEMFRVIAQARPAWVLGENVPGIIPMELDNVLSDLEGIGYATGAFVIPACAVDARHRRDRVWIVGRNMANGDNGRCQQRDEEIRGIPESNKVSSNATNPNRVGRDAEFVQVRVNQEGERQPSESLTFERENGLRGGIGLEWEFEPSVCKLADGLSFGLVRYAGRVAQGVPNRVQKLKGLGNAIVPQVAYEILREIRKLI